MGSYFSPVGQRIIAAFNAGSIKGVLFTNDGERASLSVGGQVDIPELAPSEALVSTIIRVLEDGEG